jgi:cellobiose-specific phosphotransferase system component IIA
MTKEEIKKLLENSKKELDKDHDAFVKTIQDELQSSKKKTLDKI